MAAVVLAVLVVCVMSLMAMAGGGGLMKMYAGVAQLTTVP